MKRLLRSEDGQALIITILSLTILLGFAGLATDVGILFYTKRQLQTAADSAARAAASEANLTNTLVQQAALNDATTNGATNGSNGFTVTVNHPYTPQVCTGTCNPNNYVEVIVSQTQRSLFMSLFVPNPVTVAARAVGYLKNSPGCIYAMDPGNTPNSLYLNGVLLFLNAPQCAIYIDSSSGTALNAGFIDSITAKAIGIVGNYNSGFFSSINPHPVTGIVPVSDPLAYLNPPVTGGCLPAHTNLGSAANPWTALNKTLSPGNYCGTFAAGVANPAINITNQTGITFSPGTYMINGGGVANAAAPDSGGLYVNGFGGVTGLGVTLYFYNGASFKITPTVALGGFGVKFTAPLPGAANAGVLFYQDRADISPAFLGGTVSFMDIEGAIYLPAGKLFFPTIVAATYSNYAIYVAKNIEFDGFLGALLDYATAPGTGGTSPIKSVVLVE